MAGGGISVGNVFNSAEMYSSRTKQWKTLQPMSTKRGYSPVTCFAYVERQPRVYVVGGKDGAESLSSGEYFDVCEEEWKLLPSMKSARHSAAGVVLACGTKLVVCGGLDQKNTWISSCECLDLGTHEWSEFAGLLAPRYSHCCVLYKGKPVVLGGRTVRNEPLSSCEVFNEATNQWEPLASMTTPRYDFGASVVEDMIYAAGGRYDKDQSKYLATIEVFDGAVWRLVGASLAKPRCNHTCVCFGGHLVVLGDEKELESYDPSTKQVQRSAIPSMTTPRREFCGAVSFKF